MESKKFSPLVDEVIEEMLVHMRNLFEGEYAIAIAGSHGKKKSDSLSDIDLRTYYNTWNSNADELSYANKTLDEIIAKWDKKGVKIDGFWPRSIIEITNGLDKILSGKEIVPPHCVWTIWGYHLATDIQNNSIIEDPYNIITEWQRKLSLFPEVMRRAIIQRYHSSLDYWIKDYHYENKVVRGDVLFCLGLANRLINHMIQILFALNRVYYCGDGWNLEYMKNFEILPDNFAVRITDILLMPDQDLSKLYLQREKICDLSNEVIRLANIDLQEELSFVYW